MDIIKKDEVTYIETVPEKVIKETFVEGTLDGVLADIEGTATWLNKAQEEVTKATEQLATLVAKKKLIEDLGIVTVEVNNAKLKEIIEDLPIEDVEIG